MTSKLDTAGLVERRSDLLSIIRAAAINTAKRPAGLRGPYVFDEAELQALAEALTQAAEPDMEPVARLGTNLDGESEPFLSKHQAEFWSNGACNAEPLVLQSVAGRQLSALQERVERAERERDEAIRIRILSDERWKGASVDADKQRSTREAAEARVAELEAQKARVDAQLDTALLSADPYRHIRAARAALAHKGEGR